jgi:hypothetical protein
MPAPTRTSMIVRFAIAVAQRIDWLIDPQGHGEFWNQPGWVEPSQNPSPC